MTTLPASLYDTSWQSSALLWRPCKQGQLDVPFRRKKWRDSSFHAVVGGRERFNLFSLPNEQIAAVYGVMAVCTNIIFHIRIHQWDQAKVWLKWLEEKAEEKAKERFKDYDPSTVEYAFGRRLFLSEQAIAHGADVRNTAYHDAGLEWELPNVTYFSRLVKPRPVVTLISKA